MNEINYNLQFNKLCYTLQLGELISDPEPISGGFLHRMYSVKTNQGKYAVKALNPSIMLRQKAMMNTINSERISRIAVNFVPALPAKQFGEEVIIQLDNQYYMVYDWIDGKTLKTNEIIPEHCEKVGEILAELHRIDYSSLCINKEQDLHKKVIDWNNYIKAGIRMNTEWAYQLSNIEESLNSWNRKANHAVSILSENMVISHRDLDPKNVMWNQNNPTIIDWESAGYVNPFQELTETALYWSEDESGSIDKDKLMAFVNSYMKINGKCHTDWNIVLDSGFLGKLEWLEYNLKRSLQIECTDEKEQQLGTEQVIGTIEALRKYDRIIPDIVEVMSLSKLPN